MKKQYFYAIAFVVVIALITLILINGQNISETDKEVKGNLSNVPEISEEETKSSGEETTTSQNQDIEVKYALSVSKTGTGTGSVSSAPSGINCGDISGDIDCFEEYAEGMSITLTPNAGPDSLFTGWSGDCNGAGSCNFVMSRIRTVTAMFEAVEQVSVSVSKIGSGTGTVTSSLAGINCGSVCSSLFLSGSSLQLTAVPDSESQFISWGGCDSAN